MAAPRAPRPPGLAAAAAAAAAASPAMAATSRSSSRSSSSSSSSSRSRSSSSSSSRSGSPVVPATFKTPRLDAIARRVLPPRQESKFERFERESNQKEEDDKSFGEFVAVSTGDAFEEKIAANDWMVHFDAAWNARGSEDHAKLAREGAGHSSSGDPKYTGRQRSLYTITDDGGITGTSIWDYGVSKGWFVCQDVQVPSSLSIFRVDTTPKCLALL